MGVITAVTYKYNDDGDDGACQPRERVILVLGVVALLAIGV